MGSIEKVEELLDETEVLLNDLLLSGFQGIHAASIGQMDELIECYEFLGMKNGIELLRDLKDELIKRNHSFAYNLERLMRAYSQVAFYVETCRKKI